jgi:hypothetical protein
LGAGLKQVFVFEGAMVRDSMRVEELEKSLIKGKSPNYEENLKIFEWMLEEAIFLKVLPLNDPLDGIEIDLKVAKVVNSV